MAKKLTSYISDFGSALKLSRDWRFQDKNVTLGKTTMQKQKALNIITNLTQVSKQLTQKDIAKWRLANQIAINIENPKRVELYRIYDDAMHDLHLKGAVRNRKLKVLGKPFIITNHEGKKDQNLTLLLRKRWMKEFLSMALDSKFWGHSLIQFGDIVREPELRFTHVELVPREHVCPEFHVLLKEISDDPKNGIDYLQEPYNAWSIPVGKPKDLGELNSPAKETISKKYVLAFWDQFAEIFGMPIRTATTSSRDPKDHVKIESMLEDMGAAAWGLFPEGTSIELIASKQGDSYNVYDKRIIRANSEMSKGILGQTMTMDDGSSKSQAEVHAEVAEDIMDDDRDFLADTVNDDLIPFLIKHGWPLKGFEFRWDDTYNYTPKEMKEIEEMLLSNFDVDPKYFIDKYSVPILGAKQQTEEEPGTEKKKLTLTDLPDWLIDMQEE
jgi:hypothetical protein